MPTPVTLRNELLKNDRTDKASIVGKRNKALSLPAQILLPEGLTSRQRIVVKGSGDYRLRTLESFIFHFFTCRCRFVERNSSNKRAGQRYPVSQP